MGRRQTDTEFGRYALLILFLMGTVSCFTVYLCLSRVFSPIKSSVTDLAENVNEELVSKGERIEECCKGIEHLEFWGDAVKWGADFKVNSSEECCKACKGMCTEEGGPCLCNSWVFCGDSVQCGPRFGECWLKRQKDVLTPERRDSGGQTEWTSGLVFGKNEGIIGLETEYGIIRLRLLPGCAPQSVDYILELLALHHCVGCQLFRAESRGTFWDSEGNHKNNHLYGPPFALIQGTLEAVGNNIPAEFCPPIRRGSVAWVGSGPEFIISLANHNEWRKSYTVFASVLPEDMEIVEKIAQLPTKLEVWGAVDVSVLTKPIPLKLKKISRR